LATVSVLLWATPVNKTYAILLFLLVGACRTEALSVGSSNDVVPDMSAITDAAVLDGSNVVCTSGTEDPAACSAQPGCKQFQCPGCGDTFLFCAPANSSPATVCPALGCPIEIDCKTLPTLVGNFIMGNAECKTAADCAIVSTACGLPGVCGAYVNAAVVSDLQQYVDDWHNQSCDKGCPEPPCGAPRAPQCINGQCS
jgi:hypothetical protein